MDNGMDKWSDGNEDESEEEEIRKGIYANPKHISGISFNILSAKKMKGKSSS
jgi:hypothetical protein